MSNSQPWDYFPLIELHAFTSVKKLKKYVKKRTGIKATITGTSGQCTWYEKDGGGFITILINGKSMPSHQKYALLAHECVHYAQYYAEWAGTPLDQDTEAYIVQSAMLACIDQIGMEWFTTPLQPKPKNQKKTD